MPTLGAGGQSDCNSIATSWICIAAASFSTGARLRFGRRPSRSCSYLVENSGRLVSKDELFAAVWPNLAVTDDALVQSIGELRRALGDDGPRLIRTIPRRGYRFESAVSVAAPTGPSRDRSPRRTSPGSRRQGSGPPGSAIGRHALALLKTALADWRRAAFAALALVALLCCRDAMDQSRGTVRSGDQPDQERRSRHAKPAIAILPFLNQSDDPARDYFADGVTQDIINALGRFSALTVMSWNAVLPYKGKPASPGEIAPQPRGALSGRRQRPPHRRPRAGRPPSSSIRMVGCSGLPVSTRRWRTSSRLQDRITTEIAGALAIRVTEFEQRRVFAKPTESLEAYDLGAAGQAVIAAPDAREQRGGARAAPARDPARSELRRRLCRARRNLSHRRVDGAGRNRRRRS